MTQTASALWLNTSLAGFDHFFLNLQHVLGEKLGTVLTPVMKVITLLGEKGWIFFLLALIFILTADRRDLGVCIFGAVCCGALITNIILKDHIARIRPFLSSMEYESWWRSIGSPAEDGFSFPSGHVTACAAGMTAITCMRGKKWVLPSVLVVVIMGISRNYLMAHYPSDVVAAAVIGVFSGVVAWLITGLIFRLLNRLRDRVPFCAFVLDFDIRDVLPFRLPGRDRSAARTPKAESPAPARRARGEDRVRDSGGAGRTRRQRIEVPVDKDDDLRFDLPGRRDEAPREDTYARIRQNAAAPAKETPRAAEPAAAKTAARAEAPARSGGRHAAADSGAAKKPARTRSGAYQGKH